MERLQGRVAVVTGGGSGIGRAICLRFGSEGARIVVADCDSLGGEETVAMVRQQGRDADFIRVDVSRGDDLHHMAQVIVERCGKLEILVNCAGILESWGSIVELSEEDWDRVMAVNAKGVWLAMKYSAPKMVEAGGGSIVNVASTAGLHGFVGLPAYAASKAAVIHLTRCAALEFADHNIRCNCICPGNVDTPMQDRIVQMLGCRREDRENEGAIKRLCRPAEVADAAVYLACEESSFVTGHALVVDGGAMAGYVAANGQGKSR